MKKTESLPLAILTLGLICGQLIKLPVSGLSGITLLDISIATLAVFGLIKNGISFKRFPHYLAVTAAFFILGGIFLFISPLHLSGNQLLISALYPIRYLIYILFALEIANQKLPFNQKSAVQVLIISSTVMAFLGLLQLVFIPNLMFLAPLGWDPHFFRTASTLLDPNFLGVYLTLGLVILIDQDLIKITQKTRIILFAINFLALLTTFSRSAALAFSVTFIIYSLLKRSKKILLLTAVLLLIYGINFLLYRQFISTPRNVDRNQSASFRLSSYQEGLIIFQKSPVLGIGFNSYRFALEKYQLADQSTINSRGGTSNDFSLLYVLATTGIAGILIYLDIFVNFLKIVFQNYKNPLSKLFLAFFVGLLVNSVFINSLFYPWIFIWLILIPLWIAAEK